MNNTFEIQPIFSSFLIHKKLDLDTKSIKNWIEKSTKVEKTRLGSAPMMETLTGFAVASVVFAGGYRSMIAASLMKKNGFNKLVNVSKGYSGIKKCLISI